MLEFKVSSLVHTFSKIISLPRSWISTQKSTEIKSRPLKLADAFIYIVRLLTVTVFMSSI